MRKKGKEGERVGETEAEKGRAREGQCGCVREREVGRGRARET